MLDNTFKAIVVEESNKGLFKQSIKSRNISDLPDGDILVKVKYSSLNYKDGLSFYGNKGVSSNYPHTPGIDAMGTVKSSSTPNIKIGSKVIVSGYDLGMNTAGGFGGYIRVPQEWISILPEGLDSLDSMIIGTAGLTAGLCINSIELLNHISGSKAIVTGATGGVGCIAVKLLSKLGAEVTAITGKNSSEGFLRSIGANKVMIRDHFINTVKKPMGKAIWDIAIDVAGGNLLSGLIASMKYNGVVTCCGLVAGPKFETTVFPFILRGVSLIGIDSAEESIHNKTKIWKNFASKWKLNNLKELYKIVDMDGMMHEIDKISNGQQVGRVVLKHA